MILTVLRQVDEAETQMFHWQ